MSGVFLMWLKWCQVLTRPLCPAETEPTGAPGGPVVPPAAHLSTSRADRGARLSDVHPPPLQPAVWDRAEYGARGAGAGEGTGSPDHLRLTDRQHAVNTSLTSTCSPSSWLFSCVYSCGRPTVTFAHSALTYGETMSQTQHCPPTHPWTNPLRRLRWGMCLQEVSTPACWSSGG